ncbi:MAG: PAS domain S-box protein [Myxococcales bacterium]|nr:PAS domain S-box protein [Myxococcales bacterium]
MTSRLRTSALNVVTTSGPLAHSATQIQSSLSKASARLRAWTAIPDQRFRRENAQVWAEEIHPSFARLESVRGESLSAEQKRSLGELKAELAELETWHRSIAELAHTPGNEPARAEMSKHVLPLARRILEQTSGLIDKSSSTGRRSALAKFLGHFMRAESSLQEFVARERSADLEEFEQEMKKVQQGLGRSGAGSADASAGSRAEHRRLQKTIQTYAHHAARVVKLRQRPDWNVSYYWLDEHVAPRLEAIERTLSELAQQEQRQMLADERFVIQIGKREPWVIAGLLLALLAVVAWLSGRGARRLTRRSLDRRQAKIRNDETRLRTTICTVIDPLITIDARGIIESVNPATKRIFGYEEKELIGKNVSILMPKGEQRAHDGYLRRYLETEEPHIIGHGREVTCMRKSGEEFPADLSVNEMWVNDERKFVGLVRDITERKKADQQKSDFVSVVSHELRTPLTSIRGSLGLLMSPVAGDLPESARELLAIAVRNSDRLIRLINDILDLQKIESGEIAVNEEAIDVGSFLEHAVEDNQGIADTFGVTLVLTNDAPGEKVCADRDRLMQVITNLISNALKFSPREGAVELLLKDAGDDLRFAVRDQGPGIPEEFQSKIFDRFSQADSSATRKQGGTGLGLSIAQSIMELHGGSLQFTTQEGQGTTFTFTLPKASEFETSSSQVRRTKNRHGLPVLVCEDDEGMAGVA